MNKNEIEKLFGINRTTQWNWETGKSGEKKQILYEFLKTLNTEDIIKKIEAIKLLKGIK